MKLKYDIKNKKGELELGVEQIAEKSIEHHDKNWQDKFNMKHNAKKEILEMKHKQKLEIKEENLKKKNWFQKLEEERRKTKQLKIDERKRQEEERKKNIKIKAIISIVLGIIGVAMIILGIALSSASGDPDSMWGLLAVIGMMPLCSIPFIWTESTNRKKRRI